MNQYLYYGLLIGAAGQACVAMLNLRLPTLLGWQEELRRVPRLMSEVFQVHVWFITTTLLIFSIFTWRFTPEIASGTTAMGRWMAFLIGVFWLIRTLIQVVFYSASHWRGQAGRTAIHLILLTAYGALTGTYFTAALQ